MILSLISFRKVQHFIFLDRALGTTIVKHIVAVMNYYDILNSKSVK